MVEKSRKSVFMDSNEVFYINRDRAARRQHKLIKMLGKQPSEESTAERRPAGSTS